MDEIDAKLLEAMQRDATLDTAALADATGIEEPECADRIAKLQAGDVIGPKVTLLNPKKVGANVNAFVAIVAPEHSEEWLEQFHRAVEGFPEVVEFYRMSGQTDIAN